MPCSALPLPAACWPGPPRRLGAPAVTPPGACSLRRPAPRPALPPRPALARKRISTSLSQAGSAWTWSHLQQARRLCSRYPPCRRRGSSLSSSRGPEQLSTSGSGPTACHRFTPTAKSALVTGSYISVVGLALLLAPKTIFGILFDPRSVKLVLLVYGSQGLRQHELPQFMQCCAERVDACWRRAGISLWGLLHWCRGWWLDGIL